MWQGKIGGEDFSCNDEYRDTNNSSTHITIIINPSNFINNGSFCHGKLRALETL